MARKDIVKSVDIAASIFAILLIGVFLGQAVDLANPNFVGAGLPATIVVITFLVLSTIVVITYLLFQYSLKKVFGKDALSPDVCNCTNDLAIVALKDLNNLMRHEYEISPSNQLVGKKEVYRVISRTVESYLKRVMK